MIPLFYRSFLEEFGTAMPGSWMLSFNQVQQVIKYVRSLDTVHEETVKGNPEKGLVIFQNQNVFPAILLKQMEAASVPILLAWVYAGEVITFIPKAN
jgi:hypothetical protein